MDNMDQTIGGYNCKMATNRWPLALFFNMMDVVASAAFVMHDKFGQVKWNDRRQADRSMGQRIQLLEDSFNTSFFEFKLK